MTQNGTANYIPDGYTQTAYFREVPGVYSETRVTFRPLGIIQQSQIDRELQDTADDWGKRQWIAARWITHQVISWSIKKPGGDSVDHRDINEVLRLRPALFTRIWNVLNNQDGGDVDPKASAYENHTRAQREQAVAMSDKHTVQEVVEGN